MYTASNDKNAIKYLFGVRIDRVGGTNAQWRCSSLELDQTCYYGNLHVSNYTHIT